MNTEKRIRTPPLAAIAMISAAAIAYEILLMRMFSIIQWHHFAYMMISLALLGYGASGSLLALLQERLQGHYTVLFIGNAAAFGISSVACFLMAQALPFNALEVIWDLRQPLWLLSIYLLLLIPFFFAANCICLSFAHYSEQLHRVYSADLLGAGIGALAVIGLLYVMLPLPALGFIAALGWAAAAAAWFKLRAGFRPAVWLCGLGAAACIVVAVNSDLRISEFKGLSQALRVTGSLQVDQRSSPLGLLTTVDSPVIPFRHVPGLSLNTPVVPPTQKAIFVDGDGMSVITRFNGDTEPFRYLDYTTQTLPYHLLKRPRVLVLGAGGGADVLQALHQGASAVDAVELNPQVLTLVQEKFSAFGGAVYDSPRVRVFEREARGFISFDVPQYDLIQLALMDSFAASSAGLFALSESYIYTVEAFEQMFERLAPGGILSVTRWLKLPPRDGLKVLATARDALERRGVERPADHLLMIRSWNTTTLLMGERAFSAEQMVTLQAFCQERWFDLVWYPGIDGSEANHFNQLRQPWFYHGAEQLLGRSREEFFDEYKFNVRPATDDRPHFFHFFKWRTLPELLTLRGQGGLPMLEQGYLLLVATLAQALLASLLLILLPLFLIKRTRRAGAAPWWRILGYFLAVGVGFMLIEIAFIQKFILFLSHPLYAVAVVLASFLVFAGLGSALSQRWSKRPVLVKVVLGIALISIAYLLLLPSLFAALMHFADGLKVVATVLLIAPLALLMGMPFPLGLDRLANWAPGWIPWAWGVNGCASVVSAVLATVLAIHAGFTVVIVVAIAVYGLATVAVLPLSTRSISNRAPL